MKRKMFLFLSLFMAAFAMAANTIQIRALETPWGADTYLYVWNDEGQLNGAWPGAKMEKAADGSYVSSFNADKINIIFNNGSGTQTDNIEGITESSCFKVYGTTYEKVSCSSAAESYSLKLGSNTVALAASGSAWVANSVEVAKGTVLTVVDAENTSIRPSLTDNTQGYWANIANTGIACQIAGKFDFSYNASAKNITISLSSNEPVKEETAVYTVAGGSAALFGTLWDPTATANDMTLVNGVYTLSKQAVELPVGDIEWKIVKDHSWEVNYGKDGVQGGDNLQLNIAKSGSYDVVFTFVESTKTLDAKATLNGEPVDPVDPEEDVYVVAGDEALLGENWLADSKVNVMTVKDGVATLVLDEVTLAAGQYGFKIVKNGTTWIPDGMGNDSQLEIAEAGKYKVTFTYKLGDEAGSAEAEKLEDVVIGEGYSLILGEEVVALVADGQVTFGDVTYDQYKALGVEIAEGIIIKLRDNASNAEWTNIALDEASTDKFESTEDGIKCVKAGKFDLYLKLAFGNDNIYIGDAKEEPVEPVESQYQLVVGGVKYNLVDNPEGLSENIELMTESAVAVVKGDVIQLYDATSELSFNAQTFGGGAEADFTFDAETGDLTANVAGRYKFYIVMAWENNAIYVEKDAETGLNEVVATLDVNAPIYNLLGQKVGLNYKGIVIQNGQKYLLR